MKPVSVSKVQSPEYGITVVKDLGLYVNSNLFLPTFTVPCVLLQLKVWGLSCLMLMASV